jgi:hypothetical protein
MAARRLLDAALAPAGAAQSVMTEEAAVLAARILSALAPPESPTPEAAAVPEGPLLVCCHHKSGTNVLRRIFDALGKEFHLPIWMKFYDPEPASGWRICFHQHSRVAELLPRLNFRGLHCIRHPMGLIYSAALYHEKCREPWVDVPLARFTEATFRALSDRDTYNRIKHPETPPEERQRILAAATGPGEEGDPGLALGGRTYRQMLAGAADLSDKLIVEMRGFSRGVVGDMLAFPQDARFATITLEAISHDPAMADLTRILHHLGFRGAALARSLDLARPHCLWASETLPAHATTGVSEDWRAAFTGPVAAEYRRLFGWAEQALGYPG